MNNKYSHEFFKLISMYNSKLLCRKFSELNLVIYKHKLEHGKWFEVDLRPYGLDKYFTRPELLLNHWTIRDIIIMICKRPKFDHKSYIKNEISDKELLIIIGRFLDYENIVSGDSVDDMSSDELHYMVYGLALTQFPSQVSNGLYNTIRNHIIFNKINKQEQNIIDIETVFRQKFSASYDEYVTIVMIIYAKLLQGIYLLNDMRGTIEEWESKIIGFESKYNQIINSFCSNYNLLESMDFHQIKYLYPIIDDTELVYAIDPHMLERKMYEGAYWTIREYYNSKKSGQSDNYFPNNFGILFESYIESLLAHVVSLSKSLAYVKLTDENKNGYFNKKGTDNKYVDFLIETENYQIVIECKSAIQMIKASDLYDNYSAVEKFYERNILEACIQLEKTNEKLIETNKKRVNIVLIYQEAFQKNHTKEIYLSNHEYDNYFNYLIVDVIEFEKILKVMCDDLNLARNVIESFIDANKDRTPSEGLDLEFHLSKYKCAHKSIVSDFEDELKSTILKH